MSRVRRAFLMASLEQYLSLLINFAMLTVLARLLMPQEIGVAVIGMSISISVFSLREFATPEFLIQHRELDSRVVRTSFTVTMAMSLLLAAGLFAVSLPMARFYNQPDLQFFLVLTLLASVLEGTALPTIALLRRDMRFGTLARIRTVTSGATAAATILLAWLGGSYMSYAWGLLVGAATTAALAFAARPVAGSFRPCLAAWRDVVAFGRYRGATTVIERAYEAIPQLLLGRFMPMSSVAFYNRANAICGIPDRMLLSAVFAVSFPALAEQVREGHDIKTSYLRVLSYISVVYWPALVALAITADAVVHIILGDNWTEVVLRLRLLALAGLFWFPVVPTGPLLLAMGQNRDAFIASMIARSVAATILCSASIYGIIALATSQFLALPFQMIVALRYARKHVAFAWRELIDAIRPSAVVTLWATAGPLAVTLADGRLDLSILEFCLAAVLAALGWSAGLAVTRHPLLTELAEPVRAAGMQLARVAGRRLSTTPAE